jgi:hypothetical protein
VLFALKVLAPLEANVTLLPVHACPQLVPFLQPLFAQTIKYVRQLLTELNHVLPSIAPLQLNALQTTAPKPQLRFVLCALKVNALLMKNVIPLKAHQQWEFANQLLLASPTLALWIKHVNQSEVILNAQLFLAPLILSVLPTTVNPLYLEMEFAPTALSPTKIYVVLVMSVRLRQTSTRLKVTALLDPQAAVLVKKLMQHALLIYNAKSLVKTLQFVLMSIAQPLISAKLCTAQRQLLAQLKFVNSA